MIFVKKIEVFSCFFMVGVIWLVQLVHYPSFRYISTHKFKRFTIFHQKKISFVVAPVMTLEILSNIFLLFYYNINISFVEYLSSFLLFFIWVVTFLISVPCHNQLSIGFSESIITKLIVTNWIRTLLWSFRALILLIKL